MAQFAFTVVVGYSTAGNYAANVLHFISEDPTGADPWENADALRTALEVPSAGWSFLDELVTIMSEEAFVSSLRVRQLLPTPGPESVKVFTASDFPGAISEEIEMAQVSLQNNWITNDPDHVVGKTFWPGLPTTALTDGNWEATYLDTAAAFLNNFSNPVQSAVGDFLLAVKYAGVPNVFRPIIGFNISPTPGTQRRRLTPY